MSDFGLQTEDAIGQKKESDGQKTADGVNDDVLLEDLCGDDSDYCKQCHEPGNGTVAPLDPPEARSESRKPAMKGWEAVIGVVAAVDLKKFVHVLAAARHQVCGTWYLGLKHDIDPVADRLDSNEGCSKSGEDLWVKHEEEQETEVQNGLQPVVRNDKLRDDGDPSIKSCLQDVDVGSRVIGEVIPGRGPVDAGGKDNVEQIAPPVSCHELLEAVHEHLLGARTDGMNHTPLCFIIVGDFCSARTSKKAGDMAGHCADLPSSPPYSE